VRQLHRHRQPAVTDACHPGNIPGLRWVDRAAGPHGNHRLHRRPGRLSKPAAPGTPV